MRAHKWNLGVGMTLVLALLLAQPLSAPASAAPEPYTIEETFDGFMEWAYWAQVEVPTIGCLQTTPPTITTCTGGRSAYSTHFRGLIEYIDDDTETVIVEIAWERQLLGQHLQLLVYCAEGEFNPHHPCHQWAPDMTSPVQLRIDAAHWRTFGYDHTARWQWHVHAGYGMLGTYPLTGIDIGVVFGLPFTVYVTVFQHEPAPAGYTRVP